MNVYTLLDTTYPIIADRNNRTAMADEKESESSSETTTQTKLKEERVFRVFFSSPFNGLEQEREALIKHYFPRLQSLCNSKGLQFHGVDMRWGITEEASAHAQTVRICLRELDRSDMFVGFYGQRYGWNGRNDEALQKNIENALDEYPWLENYRDRSVTEFEFIQGHLKTPGKTPACFCFRSPDYDAQMASENEGQGHKYRPESSDAKTKLDELKQNVEKTESETLGILKNYTVPSDAVEFMFHQIQTYILRNLTSDNAAEKNSEEEIELRNHEAYFASNLTEYVGADPYSKQLEDHLNQLNHATKGGNKDGGKLVAIVGPGGRGKTAFLCHWLHKLKLAQPDAAIVAYFINCAKNRTLHYILQQLYYCIGTKLNRAEQISYDENMPIQTIVKKLQERIGSFSRDYNLQKSDGIAREPGFIREKIIAIDGLDKVESSDISKKLHWISDNLETWQRLRIIITSRSGNDLLLREVNDVKHSKVIEIKPLTKNLKTMFCVSHLRNHSKDLSEEQKETVLTCNETSNPLFLKVILDELCAFGKFRQLDEKIKSLVSCANIEQLFASFLHRIEEDLEQQIEHESVIETLVLLSYGASDVEVMNIIGISQQQWSSLYYILERHLTYRDHCWHYLYPDLTNAVLKLPEVLSKKGFVVMRKKLADYLFNEFQNAVKLQLQVTPRIAFHLPRLLTELKHYERLKEVITSPSVFDAMTSRGIGYTSGSSSYKNKALAEMWTTLHQKKGEAANAYVARAEQYETELLQHGKPKESQLAQTNIQPAKQVIKNKTKVAATNKSTKPLTKSQKDQKEKLAKKNQETSANQSNTSKRDSADDQANKNKENTFSEEQKATNNEQNSKPDDNAKDDVKHKVIEKPKKSPYLDDSKLTEEELENIQLVTNDDIQTAKLPVEIVFEFLRRVAEYFEQNEMHQDALNVWNAMPQYIERLPISTLDQFDKSMLTQERRAIAMFYLGNVDEAEPMLEKVVKYRQKWMKKFELNKECTAKMVRELGECYYNISQVKLSRCNISLKWRLYGEEYERAWDCLLWFSRAGVMHERRKSNKWETKSKLEVRRDIFHCIEPLGLLYAACGQYDTGIKQYERCIEFKAEYYYGDINIESVADYKALGFLHRRLSHFDKAHSSYSTALDILSQVYGELSDDHVDLLLEVTELEITHNDVQWERALEYANAAKELCSKKYPHMTSHERRIKAEKLHEFIEAKNRSGYLEYLEQKHKEEEETTNSKK